ncbi:MAG: acetate kinase [Firmicutes bacterium GWF2_51_9]|nr:MAG: acetate kinase [Firmicutes bacterium GWF2_51_9]OGS59032.1 MAG: acetate kinase [Firmicutes bacterium GWE2_51_13]HAM62850.1 acetate kinase [Erysipelotrichaceae bacterium]HBZ40674.1 acetate kinase [Erysipelotrichaceae bacterium]
MTKVISVNAGSSSLKFQLFEMPQETVLTSGIVERIGFDDAIFSIKFNDEKVKKVQPIHDHKEAVQMVLDALVAHHIVENLDEIKGVGHRVVHGGELYANSVIADEKVEKDIEDLADLAPLHNPANLIGYRAFAKSLPHARHAMVFDTAFHQTMAPDIYLYPIPFEYYQHYKIRRYGFHGTSHYFVSRQTAKQMGKNVEDINIITCHLGNGASITAIEKGRSVNTSMGFTPLAGIMMGTRSGDIDPAIITFLMKKLGKTAEQVIDILNKKSGMLGVSQLSSDARDIEKAVEEGNEQAILTRKIYANRIAQTIGSYYMQMGSVDAIVFTGGLGENDFGVRADITQRVEKALGIQFDYALNAKSRGKDVKLSLEGSKVDVWMISTNEELVIAQDTSRLLGF